MTAQAESDQRAALVADARQAAAAQEAADRAVTAAQGFMLDPDQVDPVRVEQAWNHVVRPQFGDNPLLANWTRIIGNAGPDELAAILRFGVPMIRTPRTSAIGKLTAGDAANVAAMQEAVQRRHIASSEKGAAALDAADKTVRAAESATKIALNIRYAHSRSSVSTLQITAIRSHAGVNH